MAVSNLSPWQQFLSGKFPGKNARFTNEQFLAAANEFFGPIPIPPGSQIISQNAGGAEWIDPEGYRHSARRELNGLSPNAGQIQDNTDRPAILPPSQAQQQLQGTLAGGTQSLAEQQLANLTAAARGERPAAFDPGIGADLEAIRALAGQLQAGPQLFAPDAQTQAMLDAITARDQAFREQQFKQQQGQLVADLYGNRINQSSIANAAGGQLLQQQGLVTAQGQADAAQRALAVSQYLSNLQQQQRQLALQGYLGAAGTGIEGFRASTGAQQAQQNSLLDLLNQLAGQQTQRDIAGGQLGLGYGELAERARQANQSFELAQQKADMELAQSRALLPKILGGISAIGSLAGGIGTAYGAFTK